MVPPDQYEVETAALADRNLNVPCESGIRYPLEDCWFARPQLFFRCCLRLKDGRVPNNRNYKAGPGIYKYIPLYPSTYVFNHFTPVDLLRELVLFNTFEELNLPITGPMEDSGVVKLYEPSPTQCLYVAPVYILCVYWYILVCPILITASLKLGIYCVVFILDRAIWYSMHWIGII